MDDNKHGGDLVKLLLESDAEIISRHTLLNEKEADGHKIEYTVLSYDNGFNVGIFHLSRDMPRKKGLSSTAYHDLAGIMLKSNDEDVAQQTIDALMKPSGAGIPYLRSSQYIVAEGGKAVEIYKKLTGDAPQTAKELGSMLLSTRAEYRGNAHPNPATLFPNPQMRINLGRY